MLPVKYLSVILLLMAVMASSCRKASSVNPSRARMIGNYHFFYNGYTHYDGFIHAVEPDDGVSVVLSYIPQELTMTTRDSTLTDKNAYCPVVAHYRHDSLFIEDNVYVCDNGGSTVYTIGVKY